MRNSRRFLAILVVAALLVAVAVPVAVVWLRHVPEKPPDNSLVAPDINQPIKVTPVDVLATENFAQSLANLSDAMMFFWPGAYGGDDSGEVRLPLPAGVGTLDVDRILTNRRFLKVMQEASMLPPERATQELNSALEEAIRNYKILYDRELNQQAYELRANADPAAFGVTVANLDGPPTASGFRYQTLALLMVAGNLHLHGSAPAVHKIAAEAQQQYQELCRKERYNVFAALETIKKLSLYNRQVLATALLGTSTAEGLPVLALATQSMPRYDVQATPYDLHGRIGVVPVDMSKGEIRVSYPKSVSDAEFDEILKVTGQ